MIGPISVVTGTTHGIGRVTARELAAAGHRVVMLVRDLEAGRRLGAEIVAGNPGAEVDLVGCDLSSLASVRAAADEVRSGLRATGRPIDNLINNAGIVSTTPRASADGFELVFATNHLGPFLLTELLRDRVAAGGQIINVASCAHEYAGLDLGQVAMPLARRYRPRAAYAQSKLANVMHTLALARRLAGSGVRANCLHPGVIRSNLLPRWLRLLKPLVSHNMIGEERGARTTLHLALSPEARSLDGAYLDENQRVREPSVLARREELQESLWLASLHWVGLAR